MKTLTVTLADLEGIAHADLAARTQVEVSARYTGPVHLTDGRIIPPAVKPKTMGSGSGGTVEFEVYASDDPAVKAEFRDFAIQVTATITRTDGRHRLGQFQRTVKVLQSAASPVPLGSLPPAEGLPARFVSVDELAGDMDAAVLAAQKAETNAAAALAKVAPAATTAAQAAAAPAVTAAEAAKTQAQSAATSAQASVTLAQQAQAAALEVPDANMAAILANPATLTAAPEPVNVARFGIAADGATDDTAAVTAAVNAAKSGRTVLTNRALVLPEGPPLYINSTLDLRYLTDVRIERTIRVGPNGLVLVGHSSNQRPGQRIYLKDVRWQGTSQTNVTVRAIGMKQADVTILRASHVELLADASADATNDGSLAYNTIHLGRLDNLTLRGVGAMGWITQNTFIGGDIKHTLITGDYGHNENTWIKACVEGGTITVDRGTRNRWIEARCESGTVITFGENARRNYVEDSHVSSVQTRQPGANVVDNGVENVYVGVPDLYYNPEVLVSLDAATHMTDKWSEAGGDAHVPGVESPTAKAWTVALDTGVFPIREDFVTTLGEYESSWKCVRFQFTSDIASWRPNIYLYDEDMQPVTATGALSSGAGWSVVGDFWSIQSNTQSAQMLVQSPLVKYVRILIRCGPSGGVPFRFLRVAAFPVKPATPAMADFVHRKMRSAPYQATKPTQGVLPLGFVVQGPGSSSWKVTGRAESTLTSSASGDLLGVGSVSGMAAGDVVGVLLDNGSTHWSTVASVSGSSVTLATALPSGAPTGGRVATIRWT